MTTTRTAKRVSTDEYEWAHGHTPRGYGLWWFEFISPEGCTVHSSTAGYAAARQAALKYAASIGATQVKVMS